MLSSKIALIVAKKYSLGVDARRLFLFCYRKNLPGIKRVIFTFLANFFDSLKPSLPRFPLRLKSDMCNEA